MVEMALTWAIVFLKAELVPRDYIDIFILCVSIIIHVPTYIWVSEINLYGNVKDSSPSVYKNGCWKFNN